MILKRDMSSAGLARATLRDLPFALRALLSCFLLTLGLGFMAALHYLFLLDVDPHRRMGMSLVPGIAAKYYGDRGATRLETALRGAMRDRVVAVDRDRLIAWLRAGAQRASYPTVQPLFESACVPCHSPASGLTVPPLTSYEDVRALAAVDTGASFATLARVSHVHLFGLSLMFVLSGAIFALSSVPHGWRTAFVVMPFAAMWLDVASWWLTKFAPAFAGAVVAAGALLGVALGVQIIASLWDMWRSGRSTAR
jgi:hypothetical protein